MEKEVIVSDVHVLSIAGRCVSSHVKEDKKTQNTIILTKIVGLAVEGMFQAFSKDLNDMVFVRGCWSKIDTGALVGKYQVQLYDLKSGSLLTTLNGVEIMKIVASFKKDVKEVQVILKYPQNMKQGVVEASVSTFVRVNLFPVTDNLEQAEPAEDAATENTVPLPQSFDE